MVITNKDAVIIEGVTYVSKTNTQNIEVEDENVEETSIFLYFAACVVTVLSNVTLGIMVTWISPVALRLLSEDPQVNPLSQPISTVQLSLLGALPATGGVFGPVLLSNLFNKFGRRNMLMVLTFPVVAAMVVMALATDIYTLCIGIVTNTICLSAASVGSSMYLNEVSDDHDRAKMSCIGTIGLPLGNLLCYVFSSITLSIKGFTLLSTVPAVLSSVLTFLFLPESPVYLLSQGRLAEASDSLRLLRTKTAEGLEVELKHIVHVLEETSKSGKVGYAILFSDRANRSAFVITLGVHVINFLGGSPAIMAYLTIIFDEEGSGISSEVATILLTSVQLVAACGATQIAGRFGRRTLLVVSILVCTVMLFSLGGFFFLKISEIGLAEYVLWWPVVALVVFLTSTSLGVGSVCWIIASDLFPSNVMSAALSLIILFDGIAIIMSIFSFPLIMKAFGLQWVFFGFGLVYSVGFLFVYFVVPETRGIHLLEIQKMLR